MFKNISLIILAITLMLLPASACAPTPVTPEEQQTTTKEIQYTVQLVLDSLDHDVSNAASELSTADLSPEVATRLFNVMLLKFPFLIDVCTTDASGRMVTVLPEAYSKYEGTDISQQPVTIQVTETKKPLLSSMFTTVEGMDAVVITWPIISDKGELMGSVSALFKPADLFAGIIKQGLEGTGIAIDVMQLNGLNIYDSTGYDTGVNLFTDPATQQYTELIALGHQMVAEESGTGSYSNVNHDTGKMIKKRAYWETVKLHDTAWRVMSSHVLAE